MYTTVDEYIASCPPQTCGILQNMRVLMRSLLPETAECIRYRMPSYYWKETPVIYFAAMKNHLGLYPAGPKAIEAFKERLVPYKTTKGAIQFPFAKPIPYNLIADIVRYKKADVMAQESTCVPSYTFVGEVVHGKMLGRTVGMPTANMGVHPDEIKIEAGVYASRITVGGLCYRGVTNIGTRPTVDSQPTVTVETHILNFDEDIYGEIVVLEILRFIRSIQKFASLEEVKQQVQQDIAIAADADYTDNT
jgi:uncharacterized protein YdhG (YjbR/CyaY superfamily)